MNKKIIMPIAIMLLLSLAVFVSAQNIPPAPAPDPYPVKIIKCFDSDEGINYYSRGEITYEIIKWDAPQSHIPPENIGEGDYCGESIGASKGSCNPTSKILKEAYCEAGEIDMVPKEGETPSETVKYTSYDCSSENKVCYKGKCVEDNEELRQSEEYKEEVQECERVRNESIPPAPREKLVQCWPGLETTPGYIPYGEQTVNFNIVMWDDSPRMVLQDPSSRCLDETHVRVYYCKYGHLYPQTLNYDESPDIFDLEYKDYKCLEGCEKGGCKLPTENVTIIAPNKTSGPIELNKDVASVICQGCELDSKCYPFGFRKGDKFCSDENNQFIDQKNADSTCDNSFECSSNVCVSGKCVSPSLIEKIINWFKKLFG